MKKSAAKTYPYERPFEQLPRGLPQRRAALRELRLAYEKQKSDEYDSQLNYSLSWGI